MLLRLIVPLACACAVASAATTTTRPAAPWPPPDGPLRVIIDTDAANEIDDQYAIALAIGMPQRFHIEGFVAAHFGDAGGHAGVDRSIEELERVLQKANLAGRFPIKRGADPILYKDNPAGSEGVDFIIERALAATPEQPLWLILLGPATDAAVALVKEPRIADRMIVFWHGRTQWPVRCWNFNAYNDVRAAQMLFDLPCRLVLFDTGGHLKIAPENSAERFGVIGALGSYLQEIRGRKPYFMSADKGLFDLGDIAALADPDIARWETVKAPAVDHDLRYDFGRDRGQIVRIYHIETEPTFDLLETALRSLAAPPADVDSPARHR